MRSLLSHTPSNMLHATENLSAGVLAFLALATRELVHAGVQQTLVYRRTMTSPRWRRQLRSAGAAGADRRPAAARAAGDTCNAWRLTLCNELSGAGRTTPCTCTPPRPASLGRAHLGGVAGHPPVYYSPHGLPSLQRGHAIAGAMSALKERVAAFSAFRPVGCGLGEARELERLTQRTAAVLENPVDEAFFDVRAQPDAQPRVVTVGRACEQKGADQFAELAARFHYAGEDVRFVWVGAGEAATNKCCEAAGVEVTGWVDQDEVRSQLARAHVYVQASRWEGMALPVLQAMAIGVPCVVTDVVGNRDAIAHGATGLLAQDVSAWRCR